MSEDTTQNLANDMLPKILARLDTLEQKADAREYETRPLWERVLNELAEIRATVEKIAAEVSETRTLGTKAETRLGNIENEIKDLRRVFRYTLGDVTRVPGDIEERLDKIEGRDQPQ